LAPTLTSSPKRGGRLAVVGTGPGSPEWRSPEVGALVEAATDLVGYGPYLDLLGSLADGKLHHASDNRQELDRARQALMLAAEGRSVALVSSGDPGVFGMAAAVFEVLDREPRLRDVEIVVAPGISAMLAAAARAGAPLGHDFCVISLSDNLKPWAIVERRLAAGAAADLVVVIYNPASSRRPWQIERAKTLLLTHRQAETPVVLARNLGRNGEAVRIVSLSDLAASDVDMRTLVIVGSSQTRLVPRRDGASWVYTPRHYPE
jgi:cobalt-precorrin 5A hydrolase/precorrin-3B C17-methyltransferase